MSESFHFTGEIKPVSTTIKYRISLVLVMIAMVLLPLLYLVITGLFIYLLYWHMTVNAYLISSPFNLFSSLLYIAGIAVGIQIIHFMIISIFKRPDRIEDSIRLNRDDQPTLFRLVDAICEKVKSPRPSRIEVSIQPNAFASIHQEKINFTEEDLTLIIGLPLVTTLNQQQLAGILAHEFGHFSQRAGLKTSLIIKIIGGRLNHILYSDDKAFDLWTPREEESKWSKFISTYTDYVLFIPHILILILELIGMICSSFVQRQMEYDADRYHMELVGSDDFIETRKYFNLINAAYASTLDYLYSLHSEGWLTDNIPSLVAEMLKGYSEKTKEDILSSNPYPPTGLWDTHPSDTDRIKVAEREQIQGIFSSSQPATALFKNFPDIARKVSIRFYELVLEDKFNIDELRDGETVIRLFREDKKYADSLGQFILEMNIHDLPIQIEVSYQNDQGDNLIERLNQVRSDIQTHYAETKEVSDTYAELKSKCLAIQQGKMLVEHRIEFPAEVYSLRACSMQAVEKALKENSEALAPVEKTMKRYVELLEDRFNIAYGIFCRDESIIEKEGIAKRYSSLIKTYAHITKHFAHIQDLKTNYYYLICIYDWALFRQKQNKLGPRKKRIIRDIGDALQIIKTEFDDIPYPFTQSKDDLSIGRFLIQELPNTDNIEEIFETVSKVLDGYFLLIHRLLGEMAFYASEVESASGLAPLEIPELTSEPSEVEDKETP